MPKMVEPKKNRYWRVSKLFRSWYMVRIQDHTKDTERHRFDRNL